MAKYKVVPVEPTPEMEQAAEKYWNDRKFKALSDDPRTWKGLYAAMRAAAPTVQGEPVATLNDHKCFDLEDANRIMRLPVGAKLYAAPQPAERPPALDVSALVEALEFYARGDHLLIGDETEWEAASGEPENWIYHETIDVGVESGEAARQALSFYRRSRPV